MQIKTLEKFVGRRVRNQYPGDFFGWEGILVSVGHFSEVKYDSGMIQSYAVEDFLPLSLKFDQSDRYERGYLQILDDDAKFEGEYFVARNGSLATQCKTYDEAVTAATEMVSGHNKQSVTILRPVAVVELAAPPVRVREL